MYQMWTYFGIGMKCTEQLELDEHELVGGEFMLWLVGTVVGMVDGRGLWL